MQHEKTVSQLIENNYLKLIKISSCRMFHTLDEKPLYDIRFFNVEKFHEPGLAPVCDKTGAYHINLNGEAVYTNKYTKAYGFYCDRAAVDDNTQQYHIDTYGKRAYNQSYQWIGNYQENVCVVMRDNMFYHIDLYGNKLYREEYEYVGDYKDGIAVISKDGQATHINLKGEKIHNNRYKQLGVFHKGFATAEDSKGWFHIDMEGNAIYSQRYKLVEPFYNGLARVETHDGIIGQIDITGNMTVTIFTPGIETQIHKISSEFVGFWKTYLTNAAVELDLLNVLPASAERLSKQLDIFEPNLQRLLKALWEIGLIDYEQNKKLWRLSPKGEFSKNTIFLSKAATLWARVAAEGNWLKIIDLLKQQTASSFPSFKEKETSEKTKINFYQALLGYSALDTQRFNDVINIEGGKNMLLFGLHSLALTNTLRTQSNTIHLDYYNDHSIPEELVTSHEIELIAPNLLTKDYDLGIFSRFLQHQDDKKVLSYLRLVKIKKIPRVLLIETIITDYSPMGGALDINILVETGGKLRKLDDWETILNQVGGLKIINTVPLTDYLSVIDIRRC